MSFWRRGAPALALMLAAAATVLPSCGGSEIEPPRPSGSGATPPLTSLRRHFGILSRPRQTIDQIPAGVVPESAASSLGLKLEQSRLARVVGSTAVFLLPGSRSTCIVSRNPALGGCWPTSVVATGFASTTTICGSGVDSRHVVTVGVVPDGVPAITLMRADGRRSTVKVRHNIFLTRTSSRPPLPLQIAWTVQGRRVSHPTGLPPRVAQRGCDAFVPPVLAPRRPAPSLPDSSVE